MKCILCGDHICSSTPGPKSSFYNCNNCNIEALNCFPGSQQLTIIYFINSNIELYCYWDMSVIFLKDKELYIEVDYLNSEKLLSFQDAKNFVFKFLKLKSFI